MLILNSNFAKKPSQHRNKNEFKYNDDKQAKYAETISKRAVHTLCNVIWKADGATYTAGAFDNSTVMNIQSL